MDGDQEAYILLLLSDSNLPTGSFVASAGLESYVTHGFFSTPASSSGSPPDKMDYTVNFLRDSLATYANSALPFVLDAHRVAEDFLNNMSSTSPGDTDLADRAVARIMELDDLYETMTLNHIARRASKSQGVALLTLFSKGFCAPRLARHLDSTSDPAALEFEKRAAALVDRLKLLVRREETHGHLPICWGVLTAALGLSTGASERCRAPSMLSHPCVLHATYPSYRAEPISPFVLAGAKSSVILCPSQHNRTIRCSTATPARRATPRRYRNGTVQVPLNSPICRSGLDARRRGRHPRTRYDLAPWGDPRRPP